MQANFPMLGSSVHWAIACPFAGIVHPPATHGILANIANAIRWTPPDPQSSPIADPRLDTATGRESNEEQSGRRRIRTRTPGLPPEAQGKDENTALPRAR